MRIRHWLSALQQGLGHRFEKGPRRRVRRRDAFRFAASSIIAAAEVLEERAMLTLFIVNSTLDIAVDLTDNVVTLRDAVQAANFNVAASPGGLVGEDDGDRIRFAAGVFGGAGATITLTQGDILIADDVIVDGAFGFPPGITTVTVDGGGVSRIFAVNTAGFPGMQNLVALVGLTLQNGDGTGASAGNDGRGGAIFLGNASNASLTNVTVQNNAATALNGATDGGGGLYALNSMVVVTDSNFLTNTLTGAGASGGAIFQNGGSLTVNGGQFVSNTAVRAGGAFEIRSVENDTTTSIDGAFVSTNSAGINGGGLHVTTDETMVGPITATIDVTGGTFSNNVAGNEGGGLWNDFQAQMTVTDTAIAVNTANGTANDSGGGGLFNQGGTLTVTNATIAGNMVPNTAGSGGGILNDGGTLIVNGGLIQNNSAARAGGGIEATAKNRDASTTVTNVTITGNTAGINGGGIHVTDNPVIVPNLGTSTFTLIGGLVDGNTAAQEGGGIWNDAEGTFSVNGTTISGNIANAGNNGGFDQGGGGVFNNGGMLDVVGASITGNMALMNLGNGGGLMTVMGNVTIDATTTISGNMAAQAGGGIENFGGTVTLTGTTIGGATPADGNTAGINGGGLHISGAGTAIVIGGTVQNNVAGQEGGGLWNSATGTLTISDVPTGAISTIREATGANAAGIQATVDAFRADLGNLNPNTMGSFGTGRREINWDGVPDPLASPNAFPPAFFNSNSPRGVEFSTPGTGFQVSANAGSAPVEFGNIDASYTADFAPFSAQRLFTPIGSNVTQVDFFVPGTNTPAVVAGFGAVFTDVDLAGSTKIEFFDASGNLLFTRESLATPGDESLSFVGVSFDKPVIARVRITAGNTALANGVLDGMAIDLVVMDDFVFGEPVAFNVAGTLVDSNTANGNGTEQGGGGIFNDGGSVSVVGATISNNVATATTSGNGGGGIFNDGTLQLTDTNVTGNRAANGQAGGGGILNSDGGTLTVDGGGISGNMAAGIGGGVLLVARSSVTVDDATLNSNTANRGGAIFAAGTANLVVSGSSLQFNSAQDAGGAILGGAGSTIRIEDSTLRANSAIRGGAIFVVQSTATTIVNSTLATNFASVGGAIHATGGNGGLLRLLNTTVVDNRATSSAGGLFLQVDINSIIRDSLIIGNLNSAGNFFQDVVGIVQFGGVGQRFSAFNIVGSADAAGGIRSGRAGNKTGLNVVNVVDSVARDNGGPTLTHNLVANSPAINGGDPFFTPPPNTDQRGFARVVGSALDVGSLELDLLLI